MAVTTAKRRKISLDGEWTFEVEGETEARTIQVPGPWEAQFPTLRDKPVTATYTKTIALPKTWTGGVIRLHVGAADYYSEVSVNGYLVGVHEGGYTPFDMEVQEFLRPGQPNEIQIKVADGAPARMVVAENAVVNQNDAKTEDGRPFPFTEIPHGKQSWYVTVGGLWQSVHLEHCEGDCFVENIYVRPDVPNENAAIRVKLAHPPLDVDDWAVRVTVTPPPGAPPIAPLWTPLSNARQTEINFTVFIPGAALWDMDHPNLYGVLVEVIQNDRAIDSYATRFGMRSIASENGQVMLNGKPVFLAGVLDQDFYPNTIYTPPSTAYLRNQFKKAKHLGLNMMRCHIKTPDPRYLDLCDEIGLLVWYEIPNWAQLTKKSAKRGREHFEAMLDRDTNHASILILSIMNESWGIDLREKWQREWMVEMFDYAKAYDPTRLIVDNSACVGNFHIKSDIDDFHVYYSIPDHAEKWTNWCADFASRPAWTYSKYGDAERTRKEPVILSEFGNWGLPKIGPLRKGHGGEDPWWFKTGAGATRPDGVLERFRQYNLHKIFGTYDKLAEASQDQEWLSLKFEIEAMRKFPEIVGYVVTEFSDLHWESNGLLDMCRNPKTFHDRMASLQTQDLIIPDHKRTAFWGGEAFVLPLLLSRFSAHDLAGATLHWAIDGFPDLAGDMILDADLPVGTAPLGDIEFRVPDVPRARDVFLRLRLTTKDGSLISENYEKFSFFPASARQIDLRPAVFLHDPLGLFPNAPQTLREAGVRLAERLEDGVICLASRLDDKIERWTERGGAVLLLALDRASLPRTASGLASVSRDKNGWWGDWCSSLTWFAPNGPWSGLPQTGQFDFTFRDVTPQRVLTGFDAETEADDILSGLFIGWIHYPATVIGGFRYGDGKVLATTLELFRKAKTDPVSVVLLGNLLRHVASPKFAPRKNAIMTRLDYAETLIATGEEKQGQTWRYTTVKPSDDWTDAAFDDAAWKTGKGGFGRGMAQAKARTKWASADIWLRATVTLPEAHGGAKAANLRYFHDDDMEIWLNNEPLLTRPDYGTDYEDVILSPDQVALLKPGVNVMCVHCQNVRGPQFVDVGLTYEPRIAAPQLADLLAPAPEPVATDKTGESSGEAAPNPATTSQEVAAHEEQTPQAKAQ